MDALRQLQSIGLDYILLLFLRVSAIIWSSPVFGRREVPAMAKVALTLALSYFFYTSVRGGSFAPLYGSLAEYVFMCVKELLIGALLGYILSLFFYLTSTAGQLIDLQLGLGMAQVYDPLMMTQTPLLGNWLNVMLVLMFFILGAHRTLLQMLYVAVVRIPIGGVRISTDIVWVLVELFAESFLLGIRIALPVMAAGILVEAILGMIIHSIPQMNMFVIGMPLKIILGFLVLVIIVPVYTDFSAQAFERMFDGLGRVFSIMAGA